MSSKAPTHSSPDVIDETAGLLAGGGILTVALFPFALPLLLLTVAALLPLLVVPVAGAVVAAVVAAPVLLVRRIIRAALTPRSASRP